MKYLFAWSVYNNGQPTMYYAVRNDYTLYPSNNWDEFYKETKTYCEYHLSYFCHGYLTKDEDIQVYCHKSFTKPFIIEGNKIVPLDETDITYYDREQDNESAYFRNNTFNGANQ